MLVAQPPDDTGAVVLVPQQDDAAPNAPDPPHDPSPAALQSNSSTTAADLHSTVHDRAVPVPTRLGLDSSPALFLWESRTTNVDVMCVSNTTRPVAASR